MCNPISFIQTKKHIYHCHPEIWPSITFRSISVRARDPIAISDNVAANRDAHADIIRAFDLLTIIGHDTPMVFYEASIRTGDVCIDAEMNLRRNQINLWKNQATAWVNSLDLTSAETRTRLAAERLIRYSSHAAQMAVIWMFHQHQKGRWQAFQLLNETDYSDMWQDLSTSALKTLAVITDDEAAVKRIVLTLVRRGAYHAIKMISTRIRFKSVQQLIQWELNYAR